MNAAFLWGAQQGDGALFAQERLWDPGRGEPHQLLTSVWRSYTLTCCDNRVAKHLSTCWKTQWSRAVLTEQGLEEIRALKIIGRDEFIIMYVWTTFKDRFPYVFLFFNVKPAFPLSLSLAIRWVFPS